MQNIETTSSAGKNSPPETAVELRGSIALDQWRGLALVMVLISHGFFYTNRVNGIGRVGVNLFFFISGMLVFRSLSRSRATGGFERARSFWWRRLRRLYPAVLSYSIAMLPVVWFFEGHKNLPPQSDLASYLKSLPVALSYTINYVEGNPMSLGHLWSLACEMQFYTLAPLIFMAAGASEKRRGLLYGLILAVLAGLGLSHPFLAKHVFHGEYGKYHFEFAVWPMMAGFWCEYKRGWFLKFPVKWAVVSLWSGGLLCAAILVVAPFVPENKPLVIAAGALLLGPCLLACVFGRPMPGIFGKGMRWIGERTYSIYLWQQPLTLCNFLPDFLHPFGSLFSVALGGVWFQVFELPFLSAGRRETTKA
jgi:peptidoglycan/LPS O-acetylase OafA/YrhL